MTVRGVRISWLIVAKSSTSRRSVGGSAFVDGCLVEEEDPSSGGIFADTSLSAFSLLSTFRWCSS